MSKRADTSHSFHSFPLPRTAFSVWRFTPLNACPRMLLSAHYSIPCFSAMRVKQGGLAAKRLTRGIGLNDSKTPQPRRSPCHAPRCRGRLVVEAVAAPAPREGDVGRRRSAEITTAPATSTAAPKQHVGSLFGAVALITGSTVGAGMLALPAVTAPAGIVPTATSLTVIWGLLTLDALLIAEVNLAARAARDASRAEAALDAVGAAAGGSPSSGGIVTLRQMAEFTLGKAGKGECSAARCRA